MKCTSSLETFLVFMFFWGGREGGREEDRDLVKYFFNLEAKSFCSVFSSQHGKKIKNVMFCQRKYKSHHHPTKGKKEMWCFCQRKYKSHHHPTKGKRKRDVFAKGKTKTMTTQQKGKGSWLLLLMGHMKKDGGIQS